MTSKTFTILLSMGTLAAASCAQAQSGDSGEQIGPFSVSAHGTFDEGWAIAVEPGTGTVFLTEKPGTAKFVRTDGSSGDVTGMPQVAYGGQGGLGDFAFAPDYADSKAVYLSWAQAADGNTTRAVVGRGTLNCAAVSSCAVEGLEVIWQQNPSVRSAGHYSHKIAFSPDGEYLFVSSGERMQAEPAQDTSNNLGSVVRLQLDGRPAMGNPFIGVPTASSDIWSFGHRNMLGLQFDGEGRLWDLEHGPRGGDELNLVKMGHNYGWPVVSNGINYNGSDIPNHSTHPEFDTPAISWNPVIGPGDFLFYRGDMFGDWKGQALIAALTVQGMVRVRIEGDSAVEMERIDFGKRLRDIAEAADGSLWVIEDGKEGRLLRLTPQG